MQIIQVLLLFRINTVRRFLLIFGKILHSIIKSVLFEGGGFWLELKLSVVLLIRVRFLMFNLLFHLSRVIVYGTLGRGAVVAVDLDMSYLALKPPGGFTYQGYRFYSTNKKFYIESSQLT